MNIQKTLDSLQPYVIGIRYLEGIPLVDVVFKDGWTVPDEPKIIKKKGNDELNYYMLFSEITGVGLDELLDFVDKTIKFNIEREKKHELLRTMVNELKEVFKVNSLVKLKRLKFTFGDEEVVSDLNDFDIDEIINDKPIETQPEKIIYIDENNEVVETTEISEEDLEILAEERRAEKNRKHFENKKNGIVNKANKIELPPKKKSEVLIPSINDFDSECDCEADEACERCIDNK